MTLRKYLGNMKYKLFDVWPYQIHVYLADKKRELLQERIFNLPSIHNTKDGAKNSELELHMFCGLKYLDMGIVASWSLKRYFPDAPFFVHSDGTLNSASKNLWSRVIPSIRFTSKEEREERINNSYITDYPNLYEWRKKNWASAKIIDVHFFGKSPKILLFDSDVLFFSKPTEIMHAAKRNNSIMRWNLDFQDAYSEKREVIERVIDAKIPPRFNSGILLTTRLERMHYMFLEEAIEKIKGSDLVDPYHVWSEQTYWAILSSKIDDSQPLSTANYVISKGNTKSDHIARHYVGIPSIRPRFFLEGVPHLLDGINDRS
ncbi:MAG: hypothetical protein H6657_07775 [Ardenticatenaceae bacterium]|nr:hypothetical protein [Ardenticatenaceae bacterium]